jgi:eukaryotic-like serine/threonine-protein kinase
MAESRTAPQTAVVSADAFLRAILRSGIIDRPTLQAALSPVPVDQRRDTEVLAEQLIRQGKLTRFQAGKLVRGMSVGLILGPYQVLAPLGRGGMGTVYLARDARSQLLVALKVLPPKRAREEERLLARFRREMDMCQRVSHPHLAWAYEVGVCQGVYYIALEYIPGKSLFRLVTDEGPLSVPRAARLFGEVCSALDHAHNQGLIHRDMKPSNIMITPHDRAKVLDLGLALVQGEAPADREVVGGQGYVVGTMDYIAPEQAENASRVETSCDIYSLGCSIYFAMTGQPPFPGGSALEKIQKHRSAEPPSMALLNPTVAPGFIAIVRKMMAKQPGQRFTSAAEVREKLAIWASEDFVLPLDERGDREYQEAVAALEQATPATDVLLETLPVTPPAPGVGDSGTNMIALIPENQSRVVPMAWFLGALSVATLLLMGLAVAIFLHLR